MMTKDRVSKALSLIQYIKTLETDRARLHAENAKLREALEKYRDRSNWDGQNISPPDIDTFYIWAGFEAEPWKIAEDALSPQDVTAHAEPPETPAERATGDGSAEKAEGS